MIAAYLTPVPSLADVAEWAPAQIVELAQANAQTQRQLAGMQAELEALKHQLDWFKRQVFGQKSEKRVVAPPPGQMHLGELPIPETAPTVLGKLIPAHVRSPRQTDYAKSEDNSGLFFDEKRVPVETIAVANTEVEGLATGDYEVIGEKVSYRLAQRPGSYVILKYVRPVIKRRDSETIHCPPAPVGVIEGSRADVSFIVGLLLDKFAWHLPLYRQHQRLEDAGIRVSRAWLTQLGAQGGALLDPIYAPQEVPLGDEAQLASIRASRVKAMDETPVKAGRAGPGKMKGGYFWPIYGELDEVCFPFFTSRAHVHVEVSANPSAL